MDDAPAPRFSHRAIVALVVLASLLLALLLLWSQRKPIAAGFVDRALAARGVKGSYRIVALGLRHQRLADLRIGDPAAPDLVAREVELSLSYGFGAPQLRSITARGVRLRGRLVDGKVSFGAIDRLLPKSSGGPFALPDIAVDVADARMRLDTPVGRVGVALDGRGNLSDGFQGRVAAVAPALNLGACRLGGASAWVNITIAARRPVFGGPVRIATASCGGVEVAGARATVDARLGEALDRWSGSAGVSVDAVAQGANHVERIAGRVGFAGDAGRTQGEARVTSGTLLAGAVKARSARFDGAYVVQGAGPTLTGRFGLGHVDLASFVVSRPSPENWLAATAGTPVEPLAKALLVAMERAAGDADVEGQIDLAARAEDGAVRISNLTASAASGARLALNGGRGLTWRWPSGATRIDGRLALSGGGFPDARAALAQARPGGPITGGARIAPFAAGGARMALTPTDFTFGGGMSRFATRVTLDGPIAGGRVIGLSLPIEGRFGAGGFAINPGCAPLGFAALDISGARFGPARLNLCPTDGALVSRSSAGLRGGGRIVAPRLVGRSGDSPLSVAAAALRFSLSQPGFAVDTLAVRLGGAARLTRLDVTRLDGAFGRDGLVGRFAGAAGQIGNVPLLLSEGQGGWRMAGGALGLDGGVRVGDAAAEPRFQALVSRDMKLRLAVGVVTAAGTLREPTSGALVSEVAIRHDLASGTGGATLDVPGLTFGEGLQPEALTRLTLGVIANVEGTLSGKGEIAWSPERVTSTGRFATDRIDLAAAFGPVTGIKGEIVFTDLLGLETAPGQMATIAEVNPGVIVADGVVRYQLLAGQKVRVEGGRWPFSGGFLILQPTLIDFGQPSARRMTFEVEGLDAARFIQQLAFENIAATGTFDGVVPMVFDDRGGRIVGGRLVARAGGGTVAYVGEVTKANLGVFGKLAFDALKSIRYQSLSIDLDGALDGEIVSRVLFNGVNQQPLGSDTPFVKELKGLPFKFNITVRAPFRGLVGSARSLADPSALIHDYLPTKPVQPPVSEEKP